MQRYARPLSTFLALALLALALATAGCGSLSFGARRAFEQGMADFNAGRYAQAAENFREATQKDPDYPEAYFFLGRSYLNMQRYPEAISPLRTAYRLKPSLFSEGAMDLLVDAFFGAATQEFGRGNFSGSLDYLKEGLHVAPQSGELQGAMGPALIGLGGQLLSQGRTQQAIATFQDALARDPNAVGAWMGLASAFFQNGDVMRAMDAARRANEIDPRGDPADALIRDLLRQGQ